MREEGQSGSDQSRRDASERNTKLALRVLFWEEPAARLSYLALRATVFCVARQGSRGAGSPELHRDAKLHLRGSTCSKCRTKKSILRRAG
jgi:hypothetical protein